MTRKQINQNLSFSHLLYPCFVHSMFPLHLTFSCSYHQQIMRQSPWTEQLQTILVPICKRCPHPQTLTVHLWASNLEYDQGLRRVVTHTFPQFKGFISRGSDRLCPWCWKGSWIIFMIFKQLYYFICRNFIFHVYERYLGETFPQDWEGQDIFSSCQYRVKLLLLLRTYVVSKQKIKILGHSVLNMYTVCFWLTVAVRAVLASSGFHFRPVGFRLRPFRLRRLTVVHLFLLAPPRPPSTHIKITVAELTGAFSHWTHRKQHRIPMLRIVWNKWT